MSERSTESLTIRLARCFWRLCSSFLAAAYPVAFTPRVPAP